MAIKKNNKATVSKKSTKKPVITDIEILQRLHHWIPKMVYNTVKRYQNGALANIFNEADMTALAEDTSLEVLRRVKIGLKDPNHVECVDLKGCDAYFKRAFINQCLKIYEKHAKTDIRAGIQTTGSEEAMAVATSKNLYSPEDSYIVDNQLGYIFESLKEADASFNQMITISAEKQAKEVGPSDLQHYESIVNLILEGLTAEESAEALKISVPEYLRQKRMCFEYIKQEYPDALDNLMEHFESREDLRVHVKEVNKRQKLKQEVKDYKAKANFYVQTKMEKDVFVATLYARIDMYDKYESRSNKVPSKLVAIKVVKDNLKKQTMEQVKNNLWAEIKSETTKQRIELESEAYLATVKNKNVG